MDSAKIDELERLANNPKCNFYGIIYLAESVPELIAENRALQGRVRELEETAIMFQIENDTINELREAHRKQWEERVRELERQRDWLVNELCVGSQCDFPSQIECEYRTERGYYCPEQKEKFRCWVARAEQAAKEV